MATLAVDIGNSSTSVGIYTTSAGGPVLGLHTALPTRLLRHRELTRESLPASLLDSSEIDTIGIASVVPWATDELIEVLHAQFPSARVVVVTMSMISLGFGYPHPEELGVDRIVGALAGHRLWSSGRDVIVIDMGTATTVDCVTASGTFLGGVIMPGVELAASALSQKAVQLPAIELAFPNSLIGRTTVESMQSGILYGTVSAIEGLVGRLSRSAFGDVIPMVIATGGLSRLLVGQTDCVDRFEPNLVLEGVYLATQNVQE